MTLREDLHQRLWQSFNLTAIAFQHVTTASCCYVPSRGFVLTLEAKTLNHTIMLREFHRLQILEAARELDNRIVAVDIMQQK